MFYDRGSTPLASILKTRSVPGTEQFKKFLEKNNLHKISLHDLRHTFASILYEAGVDLKAISEALGNSDLGTTNKIYTHRFDKSHKKTITAMRQALGRRN